MKIRRTMPDAGWTPIANAAVRDARLSWRARGLLAELLSYPNDWDTSIDQLVRVAKKAGGNAEGRDAMLKAMAELTKAGYVGYVRTRGESNRWSTVIEVCDDPTSFARRHPESQCVGSPVGRDASVSADQCTGDESVSKKTDTNTDINNDHLQRTDDEYSESLTSFAVADDSSTDEEDRELKLKVAYEAIDDLGEEGRRAHLLLIEDKRPRIYREARQKAIRQIKGKSPQVLKSEHGVIMIDQLSYKYVAQHYIVDSTERRLPEWLACHLHVGDEQAAA